jgi:HAD superfamily hydrolase (TIGR01549 family)
VHSFDARAVRAVVFDIGETLVNETRLWESWADWLGITRLTFLAVLGAVIERGGDHREVFQIFRPGMDLPSEQEARRRAGIPDTFGAKDLYPDTRPALEALHKAGLTLGIAGNQPAEAEAIILALGLPVDLVASSAGWGVNKPSPEFFARIGRELALDPADILYAGDRLDNDVLPARRAGMQAALVRRGPWGWIHSERQEAAEAHLRIDSLMELVPILAR